MEGIVTTLQQNDFFVDSSWKNMYVTKTCQYQVQAFKALRGACRAGIGCSLLRLKGIRSPGSSKRNGEQNMRIVSILFALCGLLLVSNQPCFAQESLADVKPGDVPSYCGIAVGEEAQKEDAQGPLPWTLKLVFAQKETRQYLSNVEVTITDKKGTQWSNILCEGAWVVFALPKGDYKLTCVYGDTPEKRDVYVSGENTRTEYFFW